MAKPCDVLIVEDDVRLAELLRQEVEDLSCTAVTAHNAAQALQLLASCKPSVIVSDVRLPDASGLSILTHSRTLEPPPGFIVITAFGSIPQAVEALRAGADSFITKPLHWEQLSATIENLIHLSKIRTQALHYQKSLGDNDFHGIVCASPKMAGVIDMLRRIAVAPGPLLICGESGVGKELVARAIHAESDRSSKPFLAVNCASVPDELLESEFFGHRSGAFTGANAQREGLFVGASGGTLLLDEIAEMPLTLQAKLLRVLQEGKVRPLGSDTEIDVDVRIIAATNRDLEQEMLAGRFREDLFYRLETFSIYVPALRERQEDIALLAQLFLTGVAETLNVAPPRLSHEVLDLLHRYSFPGNVRELRNAIERAVTFCTDSEIQACHLPERMRQINRLEISESTTESQSAIPAFAITAENESGLPSLAQLEQRYIDYVLNYCQGNKRQAAMVLGIGRKTLYRRLADYAEDE